MFAVNVRQDRIYKLAQTIPFLGQKLLTYWLKHTHSGVAGLHVNVSNLSTNYCEARLHFSKKIQQGDFTCGLAQLCEWVAAACYSYTHHQQLAQRLNGWTMDIHKPIQSDIVAIAQIYYNQPIKNQATGKTPIRGKKKTIIKVEVLDVEGEHIASAEYLLISNPITR